MIFSTSVLAVCCSVAETGAYKRIDSFPASSTVSELQRLPDGLSTRVDNEGAVVFVDYPSGHQVRLNPLTAMVLTPGDKDHWFGSKSERRETFWCRLD